MHEVITEIREARGETKAQFAAALGCSPAMVTRLESGKREPGPELTAKLYDLATSLDLRRLLSDAILTKHGIPTSVENEHLSCGYRATAAGRAAVEGGK